MFQISKHFFYCRTKLSWNVQQELKLAELFGGNKMTVEPLDCITVLSALQNRLIHSNTLKNKLLDWVSLKPKWNGGIFSKQKNCLCRELCETLLELVVHRVMWNIARNVCGESFVKLFQNCLYRELCETLLELVVQRVMWNIARTVCAESYVKHC